MAELHSGLREAADARLSAGQCPCGASAFVQELAIGASWSTPSCCTEGKGKGKAACSVPLLDTVLLQNGQGAELYKDGRLVRVRCMIQDIRQTEYFSKRIRLRKTTEEGAEGQMVISGYWRDSLPDSLAEYGVVPVDATAANTGERQILYCVPVPGASEWLYSAMKTSGGGPLLKKRKGAELEAAAQTEMASAAAAKHGIGMIAKLHGSFDATFKLHDVIEIVGVLSVPAARMEPMDTSDGPGDAAALPGFCFGQDGELVEELLPRIHALAWRSSPRPQVNLRPPTQEELPVTRATTAAFFRAAFGGDALAAEFFLLHAISRVHGRTQLGCIGVEPLNVYNLTASDVSRVSSACGEVLAQHQLLHLSADVLRKAKFLSKKNYTTNMLERSVLQLAAGTHLLVDETMFNPKLAASTPSVKQAMECLKRLALEQVAVVDFEFYKSDFFTDVPVCLLSAAKSAVSSRLAVKLIKDDSFASPTTLDSALLDTIRSYLSDCSGKELVSLPPGMADVIQTDFVRRRQTLPELTGDDLQRWLTLSRLAAISFGEKELTEERWSWLMKLEDARLARMR